MKMRILSVDFDGVLHDYTSGWQGAHVVGDGPVPGALVWLREATKHYQVCIFSSRSHQLDGIKAMQDALLRWAAIDPELRGDTEWLKDLEFPLHKPPAFLGLDDRALCFTGKFPSMEELANFKTWQGK